MAIFGIILMTCSCLFFWGSFAWLVAIGIPWGWAFLLMVGIWILIVAIFFR